VCVFSRHIVIFVCNSTNPENLLISSRFIGITKLKDDMVVNYE